MRPLLENSPAKPSFGGHETFPIRYGWLKKGVDAVCGDPFAFGRDDALVALGVGKNMVRAIRHWCLATQLIEEDSSAQGRRKPLRVTPLGASLLSDNGWDPYLEDPASLWLVHWLLVSNTARALTWHLLFTIYPETEFTKPKMLSFLESKLEEASVRTTASLLDRDIDCLIRMYVSSANGTTSDPAEGFDSPLAELELIIEMKAFSGFRFSIGPKKSLPAEVLGYALLEYLNRDFSHRQSVPFEECLYGPGSPGQAFKLDEPRLFAYLEELEEITAAVLGIDETAGLKQIYRQGTLQPVELLRGYYER